jgi:hypothetical protein
LDRHFHAPPLGLRSRLSKDSRPHHLIEELERRMLLTGIPIVDDAFTDGPAYSGENISGRSPTVTDLPASVYQISAGYDYDQQVLGTNNGTYSDSAYFHNVGATAISLSGSGSYIKPTILQVSAQIGFELSSGYVSDAYLGFYSGIPTGYNGSDLLNFSGLELNSNGNLTLVVNGSAVNTIPFTGTYAPGTYTALSYGVNTVTGSIYDVSLAGSTSDYTQFTSNGFTNTATTYGGIGGDNDPSGRVHFASYQVAAVAALEAGAGVTSASLGSLILAPGETDVVAPPDVHSDRFVVVLNSLSIAGSTNAWQGSLDLNGNDLIVDNGNLATLTNEIESGGIISSTAAANSTHLTTLGIELNNNGDGQPLFGSGAAGGLFDGQNPPLNAVLIKYTYFGDANLDGKVDGSDYSRIDNGYLNHLTGWANGDFNGDGVIDGTDYTLIDNAFNSQGPILSTQTPPAKLVFDQPPSNVAVGATMAPAVTVDVEDNFGYVVSNDSSVVTLSIASGSGTLAGTVSAAAVNGVATFSNLSLPTMGGYTLQATDASLIPAVSPLFTVANRVTVSPGAGGLTNTDPFGVASSYTSTSTYATWASQASAAGAKWVRLFPEWSQIEPTQGTYDWSSVDAITNAAAANNQDVSGLFFYNASWVNSNTGTFPTSNLAAWSTYVSAVVSHTAGKVEYWEVWNEPENFASGGTPQDYANVVDTAYNAAKAVDPSAEIGLSVASVDINYLEQAIDDGAADHFDYISVHPYEVLGAVDQGWEGDYLSIVPTIRKMLAADDPAKENVPIWFTEMGEAIGSVNGPVTVTAASQAQDLVKAFTMGIAEGVARMDWYQAEDGGGSDDGFGLLDSSGNPTVSYTAMQSLTTYLGTNPQYQGWLQLNDTDDGFVFQGATTSVMALWAQPNATDNVSFNTNVQVVNPSTGASSALVAGSSLSLTNAPVLIVGVPADLLGQAQSNKNHPFPWGGNNSNASSVSIQLGAVNAQSGIVQLNANETSKGVAVYGSSARLSNDSYSDIYQDFEVDPNFISYSPSTVYITVVARRDANDDPAGFNVGYESTSGLLNNTASGWWSIPGNDQWYSHTFSVSDAEFDSKWAFNFDIDSDTPANGQFYIQSVTVTK